MRVLILVWLLAPTLVWGQGNLLTNKATSNLQHYIHQYSLADGTTGASSDISFFLEKLERKQIHSSTAEFMRLLFDKTRHQFLRHYTEYASFNQTIVDGKYNCLTGTALYALLLDHFGIEYKIIETNYHIFLIATTDQGKVLFEATDPQNGFVTKPDAIEERIEHYRQNRMVETSSNKRYYHYNFALYNEVNLEQMEGLLYYNLSVRAYNQKDLKAAVDYLGHALTLYNSPRIAEFSTILLLSVAESNLEPITKKNCLRNIQAIRKLIPVMASRN